MGGNALGLRAIYLTNIAAAHSAVNDYRDKPSAVLTCPNVYHSCQIEMCCLRNVVSCVDSKLVVFKDDEYVRLNVMR